MSCTAMCLLNQTDAITVIMKTMASQITSVSSVYTTVYSGVDQRKHQSSASLAFVRGIHRWAVNYPHKGPVTRKKSIWWRHHGIVVSATGFVSDYCIMHWSGNVVVGEVSVIGCTVDCIFTAPGAASDCGASSDFGDSLVSVQMLSICTIYIYYISNINIYQSLPVYCKIFPEGLMLFFSNIFIQGITNQWNCSTLEPCLKHKIIPRYINRQITYQHKIKVIP